MSADLQRTEQIIDVSAVAPRIELLLPAGVRPRQLSARTLLVGMLLVMLSGRQALLRHVHQALLGLGEKDKWRLGVIAAWTHGPHTLTYRQLEYTFALITAKLSKDNPDGSPSETLSEIIDRLLEASVQVLGEPDSSSYAVDWTDHETWARPPRKQKAAGEHTAPGEPQREPAANQHDHQQHDHHQHHHQEEEEEEERCADREAAWGHRTTNSPGKNESFFGYYLQAVTIVKDEHGPDVPELARRIHLASPKHDPPAQIVPVIERINAAGIPIKDLLGDSGYSYREARTFALPLRTLGIQLIVDLHPNDRGPKGTHQGAIISNGNLYCPATPTSLLELGPLARAATTEQTQAHDRHTDELGKYKLSPITGYDQDGYRRVICPAAYGKLRCPHRPQSMTLAHDRPTILTPPQHPPACCQQQTITVPPAVNAKTAQKHDWPSAAHRRSYNRRTGAERTFATTSDRATCDLSRGWCRLTGLTPNALFVATALIARNIRINDAFNARQLDNQRRAKAGLPPRQRRRRRQTAEDLINAANAPPEPAAVAA